MWALLIYYFHFFSKQTIVIPSYCEQVGPTHRPASQLIRHTFKNFSTFSLTSNFSPPGPNSTSFLLAGLMVVVVVLVLRARNASSGSGVVGAIFPSYDTNLISSTSLYVSADVVPGMGTMAVPLAVVRSGGGHGLVEVPIGRRRPPWWWWWPDALVWPFLLPTSTFRGLKPKLKANNEFAKKKSSCTITISVP